MGDKIRLQVEGMLPEMLAFVKRRIFTKEEVNSIMKEREDNEYLLERKTASVKDYLKVIQFEYNLEKQRRKRFKALKIKSATQKDFAIIRRIIQLWDKITYRNRYRVDLWKQYLSFCHFLESKKLFFKAVSAALRFNPYSLDLWMLAAYYESEANSNPFKGRKIFYKALKVNQKTVNFWIEYFKYEVKFIEKVMTRQVILSKDIDAVSDKALEASADFLAFDNSSKQTSEALLQIDNIDSSDIEQMLSVVTEVYSLAKEQFKVREFAFELLETLTQETVQKWLAPLQATVIADIRSAIAAETDSNIAARETARLELTLLGFTSANLSRADLLETLEKIAEVFATSPSQSQSNGFAFVVNELVTKHDLINQAMVNRMSQASKFILGASESLCTAAHVHTLCGFIAKFQLEITNKEAILQLLGTLEDSENVLSSRIAILMLDRVNGGEQAIKYIRLRLQKEGKRLSADQKCTLLAKYLSIKTAAPQSFKEPNQLAFFELCQEHLLLNKKQLESLLIPFFEFLSTHKYTQQIQAFMKKLLTFKAQCPLPIYLRYVALFEKTESKKTELKTLWVYLSQWYASDITMWIAYFTWQKNHGNIADTPALLEKASKTSGIEYTKLFSAYNDVMQE